MKRERAKTESSSVGGDSGGKKRRTTGGNGGRSDPHILSRKQKRAMRQRNYDPAAKRRGKERLWFKNDESVWAQGGEDNQPQAKRRREDSATVKKKKADGGFSKRIRNIERLLRKPDLDETVRKMKEEELKALREGQEMVAQELKEKAMEKKYRKVRFVERRKVKRKIAQLKKKLAADCGNDEIQNSLHEWEDKLVYIQFYPKAEKYISLFPPSETDETKLLRERRWREARKKMQEVLEAKATEEEEESSSESSAELGRKPGDGGGNSSDLDTAESDPEVEAADDFFL